MINVEAQYFSISRNVLLAVGLWPYQKRTVAQFQYFFVFGILTTAITSHLSPFLIAECTLNVIVEILSLTLIFILYVIEYNALWVNSKTVRYMLEQFQSICDEITDKNELAIIEKYGNISKRYTIGLAICLFGRLIAFSFIQSLPSILDIVLPRNESRPHPLLFPVEYFLDQQKYFYLVRLNTNATICIGSFVIVGVTAVIIAFVEYFCGMFAIASYRIERALRIDLLYTVSTSNRKLIFEGLISAIDIHRKTAKLSNQMMFRFEMMFVLLTIVGVLGLSINLFHIFQIVSSGINREIMFPGAFVFVILCYMFLINYLGQNYTNHNSHIFFTVYNVRWYKAPLCVQKLILFLLQKGIKDYNLKIAGGLLIMSQQCFVMLVNTSLSYFTLMYSMQR